MAILVTGGAGYVGSHCVKQLLEQGYDVVVLDNLSTGYKHFALNPAEGREMSRFARLIEGNIADRSLLVDTIQTHRISAVMHFAASCYVGESVTDPQKYYANNIEGSLQVLSAMRECGINQFIFSSSCAVYGVPETLPLTEDHPLKPISPYGFTKRVVEEMLQDFSRAYGFKYVSFRYFNAAGADSNGTLGECHEPETHLIPLSLQVAARRRSEIGIYGTDYETPDGTCIRDYVHVNDIAQAHLLGLRYLESGGASQVFNLGSETGYSVREIISACERVTGVTIPVVKASRRIGDPSHLVASAHKVREMLGWQPLRSSLDEMIQSAWQWEQRCSGLKSVSNSVSKSL